MRDLARRAGFVLAASAVIAGCGGGGGGSGGGDSAAQTPKSTALADNAAPSGFDFANYAPGRPLLSTDLVPDPARFADASRTYVSLWSTDAAGERQQLAFLRLQAMQALDRRGGLRLDLPRSVAVIGFEVYDRNGPGTALTGEIRR
jgi:hypothetical protein